jgi:hypothetical protein
LREKWVLIAKDRGISMNRLIDEGMMRVIMEYEAMARRLLIAPSVYMW